jgi:hypothetical protein
MANRTSRARLARQRAAVATRRVNAHRGEPPPPEPRRGRGWVVGIVVCALVLAGIVAVALVNNKSSSSTTLAPSSAFVAAPVTDATGSLPLAVAPTAYTVTYELQSSDDSDDAASGTTVPEPEARTYTTSTEDFRVQRPFRTHIDSRTGEPPGGDVQWSIISDFGLSSSETTGDEAPSIDSITPSAGIGDWRLDAVLADLIADKTFLPRERRTLLGRECQVYRTGAPLENYQISAPTDTTYADVCIDGSGLVLEQVAMEGGAVLEHLTATAIDLTPSLTDQDFAITGSPASLADGGTSLSPIGGPPDDDSFWGFATPPTGYQLQGHYTLQQNATDQSAVSPTGATADTTSPTDIAPTTVVTSYVDVYTSGANVIVVLQGPTSVEPSDDNPGTDANSDALGKVTVESKLTGTQILAHPTTTPDWFVEVSGSVARADLLAITGSMHNPPGS